MIKVFFKKKYILLVVSLIVILSPAATLALEVDFPSLGGIKPQDTFGPAQWINYIFVFALGVVGLALIYAFTRAGIEWMLAGESSSKVSAARERIKKAVIGLLILLGSYIILNTINPDLVNFRNPDVSFYIQGDPYAGLKLSGTTCGVDSACVEKPGGKCVSGKCGYPNANSFTPKSRKTGDTCDKDLDCESGHCRATRSGTGSFCGTF